MVRMSAEERRASVIRAAIVDFGRGGLHGTPTEAIARRSGVSQPYLFRLFPNKRSIFLAAALHGLEETRRVIAAAVDGLPPEEAYTAATAAYRSLIQDPDKLRMQLQLHVAVAAAEATGDHEFAERIRAAFSDLYDLVLLTQGGDAGAAAEIMGYGTLISVLVALGFPAGDRVWDSFQTDAPPLF